MVHSCSVLIAWHAHTHTHTHAHSFRLSFTLQGGKSCLSLLSLPPPLQLTPLSPSVVQLQQVPLYRDKLVSVMKQMNSISKRVGKLKVCVGGGELCVSS